MSRRNVLKLIVLAVFFSFFLVRNNCCFGDDEYIESSIQKLDNGISVVFIDTTSSGVLVMLCISAGGADDFEKKGVANLLSKVFAKKLRDYANANTSSPIYGSEINSYAGCDQSIYYFYGKPEQLENVMEIFGSVYNNFQCDNADIDSCKKAVEQSIADELRMDVNLLKSEVQKAMSWHSRSMFTVAGDIDDIRSISMNDLQEFHHNCYRNAKATIVIAGAGKNVKKDKVCGYINKYFKKDNDKAPQTLRLQEPDHRGSTVKIVKNSDQINVPIIKFYWVIPSYKNDKNKARSLEIFVNHLDDVLQNSLVVEKKIATSISFCYSFWNYDSGDFCIAVVPKNADQLEMLETAVLAEIKYTATNGMTKAQTAKAVKKLLDTTPPAREDAFGMIDWLSKKIAAGYAFDFLKEYKKFINKYDLDEINECARKIFGSDPAVISIMQPNKITAFGKSKKTNTTTR
ncbi:MAG: insulinase family protein [Holosporaceae bacterium]|jgi:predicted Zn-dependent peptidase|nr:insulinase family protein [Holosporaceae bacterium]